MENDNHKPESVITPPPATCFAAVLYRILEVLWLLVAYPLWAIYGHDVKMSMMCVALGLISGLKADVAILKRHNASS